MNQREIIMWHLALAGEKGKCGTDFLALHIPRYSARIKELRDRGAVIERFPCDDPRHETPQFRYRLCVSWTPGTV